LLLNEFQSSRALTAWSGSIFNGVFLLAGPIATSSIERIGCRLTIMAGGVLTMIGFAFSSLAPNLLYFYFTYGIVAAFGCCLNYTGFIIAMSTYFRKMYAVAFSVTQAGVGVGLFFFGSLFQWLIERFGWRASFLLSGAIGFHFTLLGALVFPLRQPKNIATNPPEKDVLIEIAHAEEVVRTLPATATRRDVCREQLLHFSSLFWMFATPIPFTLLADFVASKSLDDFYIYTLQAMGLGDMIGRLLTGPLIEYMSFDSLKLYAASQTVCALSILSFVTVFDNVQLVVQALIFGMSYGCQSVLLALVPHHLFGSDRLNAIFGLTIFYGGAGVLTGPPIAGLLLDLTESYMAVFILSGLAECIALVCTFSLLLDRLSSPPAQSTTVFNTDP